ncbi:MULTISPECIES: hypothetical protein [Burkholderia]|uniref:hypothetical protein n=2 Tax=Burkholderiaceae TaxID=119060 RepID=UPI001905C102|nr:MULTISPECIES: hypothetical protein [Burkholderia]MBJ9920678.1 hypothetical protein [Burkholderia cenocepacia]MCA8180610.1 hypothetical protein [Burkholderia vietnamiensis]
MTRRPFPFRYAAQERQPVTAAEQETAPVIVDMQRAKATIEPRQGKHVTTGGEETVAWPSPFTPNALLRFALFGAQRERMAAAKIFPRQSSTTDGRFLIAETAHYRIEYDGDEALNADDLMVLLVCFAIARNAGDMGAYVPISLSECNRYLWKSRSGKNTLLFRQSLMRLYKGYVKITVDGVGIKRQRFLANYDNDDTDSNNPVYWIRIDKGMAPLFEADATEIDVVRMAHLNSYLAKWLHGFYSTHDGKKDYSVSELQELSGSSYLPLFKFRAKLREAVKELRETKTITNEKGDERTIRPLFGEGTTITKGDRLHVVKASRSMMIGPAKKGAVAEAITVPVTVDAHATRRGNPVGTRPTRREDNAPFGPAGADPFDERDRRSPAEKAAARQRSRVAL